MSDEQISQFVIQSEIDNQKFTVDKKVIFSSVLLKNICDITDITEPILVKCPGDSLKTFISLINHYQTPFDQEHDDKFEKSLYCSLNKNELINLIQDLCVLDSDFFLDSIADYILEIIGEVEMDWNDIQNYLELENDFTVNERILIDKNEKLEYFLSLDTENFTFTFFNKNLYSLKSAFWTPLNVLMARIIQRSSARTSYLLSLINKTIKNEVDRYPFKLTRFSGDGYSCHLSLYMPEKINRGFLFYLNWENFDEKYFNTLKERKIIAEEVSAHFDKDKQEFFQLNSLNFIISKEVEITFGKSSDSIYRFNVEQCPIPSICYKLQPIREKKFEDVYKHLIAKDLSKQIEVNSYDPFKFFWPQNLLRFHKKPNSSKFYSMKIHRFIQEIYPEFKTFINNYMEDNGIIKYFEIINGIPLEEVKKVGSFYEYSAPVLNKYWQIICKKVANEDRP